MIILNLHLLGRHINYQIQLIQYTRMECLLYLSSLIREIEVYWYSMTYLRVHSTKLLNFQILI